MRHHNLKKIAGLYKLKFRWSSACVYCGEPANSKDHVLAISWSTALNLSALNGETNQAITLVPACIECNDLAGSTPTLTVKAKRALIHKKLRTKYKNLIEMPDWDQDEINQTHGRLKQSIIAALKKRQIIWNRVTWPKSKTKKHWSLKTTEPHQL